MASDISIAAGVECMCSQVQLKLYKRPCVLWQSWKRVQDFFDIANADFTWAKMPFAYGLGVPFITGTNVMLRARGAFASSKFAETGFTSDVEGGHRQVRVHDHTAELHTHCSLYTARMHLTRD